MKLASGTVLLDLPLRAWYLYDLGVCWLPGSAGRDSVEPCSLSNRKYILNICFGRKILLNSYVSVNSCAPLQSQAQGSEELDVSSRGQ